MTDYPVHAGDTVTIRARSDGGWLCPDCKDTYKEVDATTTWDDLALKLEGKVVHVLSIISLVCTYCSKDEILSATFMIEGHPSWCPIIWCEPMEVADALHRTN